MGKTISKTVSKNLSGKYSQKVLGRILKSGIDALKTASKRIIQKTAIAIGDVIGKWNYWQNSKTSPKTVKNEAEVMEFDRKIPKKAINCLWA